MKERKALKVEIAQIIPGKEPNLTGINSMNVNEIINISLRPVQRPLNVKQGI